MGTFWIYDHRSAKEPMDTIGVIESPENVEFEKITSDDEAPTGEYFLIRDDQDVISPIMPLTEYLENTNIEPDFYDKYYAKSIGYYERVLAMQPATKIPEQAPTYKITPEQLDMLKSTYKKEAAAGGDDFNAFDDPRIKEILEGML